VPSVDAVSLPSPLGSDFYFLGKPCFARFGILFALHSFFASISTSLAGRLQCAQFPSHLAHLVTRPTPLMALFMLIAALQSHKLRLRHGCLRSVERSIQGEEERHNSSRALSRYSQIKRRGVLRGQLIGNVTTENTTCSSGCKSPLLARSQISNFCARLSWALSHQSHRPDIAVREVSGVRIGGGVRPR
jgi:hypothetical protein